VKRVGLIAGMLFLLLSAATGAVLYWKPEIISAESKSEDQSPNATAVHADRSEAEIGKRKNLLRLIGDLGNVQDKIIRGDREALGEQGRLLREIAAAIRGFGQNDWDDYVNMRAAFIYVLSGGNPDVLTPLLNSDSVNGNDKKLAQGISDFARGRAKSARKLLQDVDPRLLDVGLTGPFALARGSLYVDQDQDKAIGLLDEARLSSPHTAIEEAAARREIPLLLKAGDDARAIMLAGDYVRRFGRSIYAWKLFGDFAEAAAKRDEFNNDAVVRDLIARTEDTDQQAISELLLDLSGQALLSGKLELAKASAGEVVRLAKLSEEDLDKARLYKAAAEAPSGHAAEALQVLGRMDVNRLSEEDIEIRKVAHHVARVVVGADIAPSHRQESKKQDATAGSQAAQDAIKPAMARVGSAVANADATLNEADLIISGGAK